MGVSFEGRVIAITGAGRGIGREHALLLASLGAQLVVNDVGGGTDGVGGNQAPATTPAGASTSSPMASTNSQRRSTPAATQASCADPDARMPGPRACAEMA